MSEPTKERVGAIWADVCERAHGLAEKIAALMDEDNANVLAQTRALGLILGTVLSEHDEEGQGHLTNLHREAVADTLTAARETQRRKA